MFRSREQQIIKQRCASGSVVEYRLAKARVAGSNPVSRLQKEDMQRISSFCKRGGHPNKAFQALPSRNDVTMIP